MKKINFLNKLYIEEKLKLVEPSNEIKDSYIEKSESNLLASKVLLEKNLLKEAISMTYYSMYHITTALFFKCGIKCENHSATIIILKEIFALDNREIFNAKEERIDKQYYTNFHINKQDILEAIRVTEKFNSNIIDFISKITNEKIKEIRRKILEAML
jgi:uncharacterized protein (UPF0332 family)